MLPIDHVGYKIKHMHDSPIHIFLLFFLKKLNNFKEIFILFYLGQRKAAKLWIVVTSVTGKDKVG